MKLSVCVILLIVNKLVRSSSLKTTWLVPCSTETDCLHLQNATCINEYCNCGELYSVCEEKTDFVMSNLGKKCIDDAFCNVQSETCGPDGVCICKKGYFAAGDSQRCLKVLGTNCMKSEDCNQLGQPSDFVCDGGQCRCKSDYREENGSCKKNHASALNLSGHLILAASLSLVLFKW